MSCSESVPGIRFANVRCGFVTFSLRCPDDAVIEPSCASVKYAPVPETAVPMSAPDAQSAAANPPMRLAIDFFTNSSPLGNTFAGDCPLGGPLRLVERRSGGIAKIDESAFPKFDDVHLRRAADAVAVDRRLVSGAVAAVGAVLLATGGSTLASFDDAADVPHNSAGAGVLVLDLHSADSANAAVRFAGLMPGQHATQRVWIARNDPASTVPATMTLTIRHLVDTPAPCDVSLGKAQGELASHIAGCRVRGNAVSGRPAIGVASRLLQFGGAYVADAGDPASCNTAAAGVRSLFPSTAPGNLYAAAHANYGRGITVPIVDSSANRVVLAPGHGICVSVDAYFPPGTIGAAHASPRHPVDNAAQGDSLSVQLRFTLTQVAP